MTSPAATLGVGLLAGAFLLAGLALGRARSAGAGRRLPRALVGTGIGLLGAQAILLGLSLGESPASFGP